MSVELGVPSRGTWDLEFKYMAFSEEETRTRAQKEPRTKKPWGSRIK
jgi:hypothetical protein